MNWGKSWQGYRSYRVCIMKDSLLGIIHVCWLIFILEITSMNQAIPIQVGFPISISRLKNLLPPLVRSLE